MSSSKENKGMKICEKKAEITKSNDSIDQNKKSEAAAECEKISPKMERSQRGVKRTYAEVYRSDSSEPEDGNISNENEMFTFPSIYPIIEIPKSAWEPTEKFFLEIYINLMGTFRAFVDSGATKSIISAGLAKEMREKGLKVMKSDISYMRSASNGLIPVVGMVHTTVSICKQNLALLFYVLENPPCCNA